MRGITVGGYRDVVPHSHDAKIYAFVLDFAASEMADADLLRKMPSDKKIHAGVIDVRTLEIEHPEQVADRIRKVLKHTEVERVTLTTDCGLKQLPRVVAVQKLPPPLGGAAIGRKTANRPPGRCGWTGDMASRSGRSPPGTATRPAARTRRCVSALSRRGLYDIGASTFQSRVARD